MRKPAHVTLMLAWYDEPPDLLHNCITSAAVIADKIIAADGSYEQVPDPAAESDHAQKQAIIEAAQEAGIELQFLKPRLWNGQVEKRNALLKAATHDLKPDEFTRFVMPLDADWILKGDREQTRRTLVDTYIEQFYVQFHQPTNPRVRLLEAAPHEWHVKYDGRTNWEPLLFRALYRMKLEKTHWHYSGERRNGTRVGLSGGVRLGYAKPISAKLRAPFLIEHRCMFRDRKQLERNREFCKVRDEERELIGYER